MVRKQVYLEARQARMVKRRAKQRRVSEGEIIRDALDLSEAAADRQPQTPDPEAGRKLMDFIHSLSQRPAPSERDPERTWTRESLYEERINRWTKS
jgi:hypothetical protein